MHIAIFLLLKLKIEIHCFVIRLKYLLQAYSECDIVYNTYNLKSIVLYIFFDCVEFEVVTSYNIRDSIQMQNTHVDFWYFLTPNGNLSWSQWILSWSERKITEFHKLSTLWNFLLIYFLLLCECVWEFKMKSD